VISVDRAETIPGWMRPEELRWLAEQAATRRDIAEIGSWMGRSTRALADHTPGTVYAVDTWQGSDEPVHRKALADKPKDWLYRQFCANLADLLAAQPPKVIAVRRPSVQAARRLRRLRFDLIFLDGAHDYASVRDDLAAWAPLLRPGGLLCGHDWGGSFPGVEQAVREAFPRAARVGVGKLWAITPQARR
jgi:predicted O-methyltransferase YrrM